ncbi:hypothetical protein PQQ84_22670 [Paraburkholderia strydomiana]|uniref:hypothetical protein n=1 Tax=Paraburkholderia strydomiana TaxID=1245417 RepID=UPI0038BAE1F7
MKRLFLGAFALILSIAANATTFTPIQLLNPAGSTSGQVIVSSGPSTVPAWGGIGVNGITAIAANTVLANATGSSASPTAFAMPSCSTSASILQYTSNTGFTCSATIWASPPAIGATTPGSGKFTTLQATSTITPSSAAGIAGTTTNDNANAGSVGEFVSSNRVTGSALSLTNNTAADITSVSLTAGDWDCRGGVGFTTSAGASGLLGWINNASVAQPLLSSGFGNTQLIGTSAILGNNLISIMPTRISAASTVTVYLSAAALFSSGTASAYGYLGCRRVR